MIPLWLMFVATTATPPPPDVPPPNEWPPVARGLWHIEGTLSTPGKKDQHWHEDTSQCTDPRFMFQGAFDEGIIEIQGCRYESSRSPDGTYAILGECVVRGVGILKSHSTVALQNDRAFTMTTTVKKGKRQRKIVQIGNWKAACTDER